MARGRINLERWGQFYLRYWLPSMQLAGWRVTIESRDRLWDKQRHEDDEQIEWIPTEKTVVILLSRHNLRTKKQVSEAVWHALGHIKFRGIPYRFQEMMLNQLWPIFSGFQTRDQGAYIYHE